MTPLAQRIVRELTMPIRDRSFDDQAGLLRKMDDIHCFEVSAVDALAAQLGAQYPKYGTPEDLMFLPAPKTWIEMAVDYGRQGFLIEEVGGDDKWRVTEAWASRNGRWRSEEFYYSHRQFRLRGVKEEWQEQAKARVLQLDRLTEEFAARPQSPEWFRAILAIINTPRLVGRRQHMPHRGLERRLIASRAIVGKFPLHAWTEILLEVHPPRRDESGPHEAHLTGRKALHFCRAHLRVKRGALELVSAHWRGDGALGIIRSRYIVGGKRRRAA